MNDIVYNKQYDLWVPTFEPRLMNKDWFEKTYRTMDRNTREAIRRTKEKKVCVQAGGHLGIWPKYLSRFYDKVITFECDPILFNCVKKNTGDKVICIEAALGNKNAKSNLYRTGKSGTATLARNEKRIKSYDVVQINEKTLDSYNLDRCDTIFLDIERHEVNALEGAEKTIKKYRPIIQTELHDQSKEDIIKKLEEYDYKSIGRAGSRDEVFRYNG